MLVAVQASTLPPCEVVSALRMNENPMLHIFPSFCRMNVAWKAERCPCISRASQLATPAWSDADPARLVLS